MKINELRVNNWYNSVKFNVPVKCELSDLYELCARSDGAYNDPPIDEMFEPIPLTEEWLFKFGFYINEKSLNLIHYSNGNVRLNCYNEEFNGYWLRYYHGSLVNKIQYVHQLQNLYFALTGEELTIKS